MPILGPLFLSILPLFDFSVVLLYLPDYVLSPFMYIILRKYVHASMPK